LRDQVFDSEIRHHDRFERVSDERLSQTVRFEALNLFAVYTTREFDEFGSILAMLF